MSSATGIAGQMLHEQTRFFHAAKSVTNYIITPVKASFFLESANAKLVSWESGNVGSDIKAGKQQTLRFDGHLPLHVRLVAPGCELQPASGQRAFRRGGLLDIEASGIGTTTVVLRCA